MGGIIIESDSEDSALRVGVGINRRRKNNEELEDGAILINNSIVEEFKKLHPIAIQNSEIKKLNEFDNKELWKNPHQNILNTKTLVKKI